MKREIVVGDNLSGKTVYNVGQINMYDTLSMKYSVGKIITGTKKSIASWQNLRQGSFGIGYADNSILDDGSYAGNFQIWDFYAHYSEEIPDFGFTNNVVNEVQMPSDFGTVTKVDYTNDLHRYFKVEAEPDVLWLNYTTTSGDNIYKSFQGSDNAVQLRTFVQGSVKTTIQTARLYGYALGAFDNAFDSCSSLVSVDMDELDISGMTSCEKMFLSCSKLERIYDRKNWTDFISLSKSTYMFRYCTKLVGAVAFSSLRVNASMANTSTGYFSNLKFEYRMYNATDSNYNVQYFGGRTNCVNLKAYIDSNLVTDDIDDVILTGDGLGDATSLFDSCGAYYIDVSNFNTSQITNMFNMFADCFAIKTLSLLQFSGSSLISGGLRQMFFSDWSLKSIICNTDLAAYEGDGTNVFTDCSKLKGAIEYDSSKTNSDYANPTTGYFLKASKSPGSELKVFFNGVQASELMWNGVKVEHIYYNGVSLD